MQGSIIIRLCLAAFFWCMGAGAVFAENTLPDWAERSDDEMFVFGLQLDRYALTDAFLIFFDGKEAFVPLGGITQVLEFLIEVDPEKGLAQGWFLNDDRSFTLDLRKGLVTIKGRSLPVPPKSVERHPDDIYVSLSQLEAWFPLLLDVQFSNLQIEVKALEPLPLQERIAKEKRRAQLSNFSENDEETDEFSQETGWFEWPFVDVSSSAGWGKQADENGSRFSGTATVIGIVAGLDSELTAIASNEQEIPNIRMRLGRRSPSGGLLGILDAREFSFGDVATPDLPLIADNTVGRGFEISSYDLNQLEQTNRVTLRGELPAGWEVEVYRNGELIDFQTDQDVGNGRYEFLSLSTVSGLNEFRLVFFGPQGQSRERVERYFVSAEMAEPNRSSFRLAFNQSNKDLIAIEDVENVAIDDGEDRLIFQVEHGISETMSIRGGVASYSLEGDRRNYVSGGLQTSLFGALVQVDIAVDDTGGLALGGRAQTQFGSWSLTAEQMWYQDFHSEQSDNGSIGGYLRSRTLARVNGQIPDFGLGYQPLTASITHEVSEDGHWQTQLFGRVSSIIRPFNLALSTSAVIGDAQEIKSDARLLVGTLIGDFRLRGEVGFEITPEAEFAQATLSTDWRIDENFGARVSLSHYAGDDEMTTVSGGIFRQFDRFNLGFNIAADSHGDFSADFGLSFSFGHNPKSNSIELSSKAFARQSAVSAEVFLDRDNDGLFGPNDEAIEGVGFVGSSIPKDITTKEDGSAFVVGLEPYDEVKIGVNVATLQDPFWVPANPLKSVIMRPGTSTKILFPVIQTGEVDGLVLLKAKPGSKDDASAEPGSGLRVLLVDAHDKVVADVDSTYDGFFFIDRVPYGDYTLKLDEAQAATLGYSTGAIRQITIGSEEPFAIGQDLFVTPNS